MADQPERCPQCGGDPDPEGFGFCSNPDCNLPTQHWPVLAAMKAEIARLREELTETEKDSEDETNTLIYCIARLSEAAGSQAGISLPEDFENAIAAIKKMREQRPRQAVRVALAVAALTAVAEDAAYECHCGKGPYTDGEKCPVCFARVALHQLQANEEESVVVRLREQLDDADQWAAVHRAEKNEMKAEIARLAGDVLQLQHRLDRQARILGLRHAELVAARRAEDRHLARLRGRAGTIRRHWCMHEAYRAMLSEHYEGPQPFDGDWSRVALEWYGRRQAAAEAKAEKEAREREHIEGVSDATE